MTNATQDYGNLRVTMTSAFDWVWKDYESGALKNFEAHHPKTQGNLRPLGTLGFSPWKDRNGNFSTILVGSRPGSSGTAAVASPTGYDLIWHDENSGGRYDGAFWRPRAPSGYVSLGDSYYFKPKVRDDQNSGAKTDCSVWEIGLPSIGVNGGEKIPISSGTFRANNSWSEPNNGLAQVLVLPNPKKFAEFTASPPTFTKKKEHSERWRSWYVHIAHTNNSGGEISDSTTVTKGVSKTQSEEMSHSAGVSISTSYGVKGFGMDVSLNYQFTSTTSSSFTEFEDNSRTQGYTIPAYQATIFLSKRIWIQAIRADGSLVLKEINFNANDDIHLIGVSLK